MVLFDRSDEFAADIVEAHEVLGARLEIPQLDLTVCELVTEDQGEVCAIPCCGLQLAAELANAEVRSSCQARRPELRRHAQSVQRIGWISRYDHRIGWSVPPFTRRRSLFLEYERHPIKSNPEADPGCGAATQKFDQTVIPAAATERLLLS